MKILPSVAAGFAGACVLTGLHQIIKNNTEDAPRMDLLGMQALKRILKKNDQPVPSNQKMYYTTLAGDVLANTLYYSLLGIGKKKGVYMKGAALGAVAGAGAVLLPQPLKLNEEYANKTTKTSLLTFGLYFAGGLVAAGVADLLRGSKNEK